MNQESTKIEGEVANESAEKSNLHKSRGKAEQRKVNESNTPYQLPNS